MLSGNVAAVLGKCISHSRIHSPEVVVRLISYKLMFTVWGGGENILANVC